MGEVGEKKKEKHTSLASQNGQLCVIEGIKGESH